MLVGKNVKENGMDVNYSMDDFQPKWILESIRVAKQLYTVCSENVPGVMEVTLELMSPIFWSSLATARQSACVY